MKPDHSHRLAALLIEQFGEAEAARYVVERTAESSQGHDLERRRHWRLIMVELERLLMQQQHRA